jgi:hypothetical protein
MADEFDRRIPDFLQSTLAAGVRTEKGATLVKECKNTGE